MLTGGRRRAIHLLVEIGNIEGVRALIKRGAYEFIT